MVDNMSVSLVMPCYNEEEIIEQTVRAYYYEIISKIEDSEFIVIDDCSKDNSHDILRRLNKELPKLRLLKTLVNSGHGGAIRMGYEAATKRYVFQIDSDSQFNPHDFWKLYAFLDKYDFVLGFRKKRNDPIIRLILTKMIYFMDFVLFRVWIKDANCPFRLIKREVLFEFLKSIDIHTLSPNLMISILAKKRGIRIKEVPVIHYARETGKSLYMGWNLIIFAFKSFKQLLNLR